MFFEYSQNNSGGVFKDFPAIVVIEADNANHANFRAKQIGLYFDGVEKGIDCPCCGCRWYRAESYHAEPHLVVDWVGYPVYYMDGTVRKMSENPLLEEK